MNRNLMPLFGVLILMNCHYEKKEKSAPRYALPELPKNKTVSTIKNKEVLDTEGVANVLITTNDAMKFSVTEVRVRSGQSVRLTLKHTGKLDKKIMGHNVVILKKESKLSAFAMAAAAAKDNDFIPVATDQVIAHTKMIGGGEITRIEFKAPSSGIYDYLCSFPGHYSMMRGKLIVE